ncbi:TBC1 domain family member 10B-like [Ambystoma mexicanum]|uniref:TBC1 domain family member 10B-like n=1 Tax=Ambystoma mexicanum TaxID=8296 RepID=UPI0037E74B68
MEAPLPQPPQPGVTSPPLRPKPTPPPRKSSFRRGSQDGRPRPDGTRSPSSGSNPSSPPTSPQRMPADNSTISILGSIAPIPVTSPTTSPQHGPLARGSSASTITSQQNALDTSTDYASPQQSGKTKGIEASQATSPPQALSQVLALGTIECLAQPPTSENVGIDQGRPEAKTITCDARTQGGGHATTSVECPLNPHQGLQGDSIDQSVCGATPVTISQFSPPATSLRLRTEINKSDPSLQRPLIDRPIWRAEMSTSFSSSPLPHSSTNHVPSPQQMLERSRPVPTSPRWVQPEVRGTDSVILEHPRGVRQSPPSSPHRESSGSALMASGKMEVASAQFTTEAKLRASSQHGVPESVTDTVGLQQAQVARVVSDISSSQQVPGARLFSEITSPQQEPQSRLAANSTIPTGAPVVSPKRVYSYSVILMGTSKVQSGSGASTNNGTPAHRISETVTSADWFATPLTTSPLIPSPEPQTTMSTNVVLDSPGEGRPDVNSESPKKNLASKPPLPCSSGHRAGSSAGQPGSTSLTPSSLQYIAPKSTLYSSLSPVLEQPHNNADHALHGASGSEPVMQSGSGSALVPESTPASSPRRDAGSLSSLDPGIPTYRSQPPAPDSMSYLDSVSMMSGTVESLSLLDDASSLGSDSEVNGMSYRRTDKYGFLGGNQFSAGMESSLPVDVARQRELKWLDMFKHWDKWVSRRFQKVKLRCRKGIPSSLRAKAWQCLSNSIELIEKNQGKFEELERNPGDPKWLDVIEKDLHRQFPFHEMFAARGGHGQQDLYRILKAYTIYRPDEGYCQAQAPVAAVLLMHMPAEQAFWCLVQICEKYLPGYYSAGLEAIQLDGEIFFALLRRASPMAYRHLKKYKIDPILYMTEWFMCIFSRTLPWSSVLRVWDMFFCEGVKIIFRVGLVILRQTLGSVDKLRSCQGMYETMEKLRNLPTEYMHESFLVHEVSSLPVTEALIERENSTQLKKWRENRGELQYKPSRRLHGTRAIFEEHHRMNPPLTTSSSLLSLTSLRRASKDDRWRDKGQKDGSGFSPAHSIGNLALSSGPTAAPPAANVNLSSNNVAKPKGQKSKGKVEKVDTDLKRPSLGPMPPGQVVSEGLHPVLPSPTGNVVPLGDPKKAKDRKKEKDLEKQRAKEQKEKERQDKERERLEKEREKEMEKQRAKEQKEKERLDKERERLDKEKEKKRIKEEAKMKKERKLSIRKKDAAEGLPGAQEKGTGDASTHSEKAVAAHNTAGKPASQLTSADTAASTSSPGPAVVQDSYF